MTQGFKFEMTQVQSPTTERVGAAIIAGHGAVVTGAAGSGKTHAVLSAVDDALWSEVPDRPFAVPRVIADLCAQSGVGDRVLRTYAESGWSAACRELDAALGGRTVVIDGAERLSVRKLDPVDPDASDLWAEELRGFGNWIFERCASTPTFALTRHLGSDAPALIAHQPLVEWPVKLTWSSDGFLDWKTVAERVSSNPAALSLASAALRLAGVDRMCFWLMETEGSTSKHAALLLAEVIHANAPRPLRVALAVVHAAGELQRVVVDEVAEADEDLGVGLQLGLDAGLLRERDGVVTVMPYFSGLEAVHGVAAVGASQTLERLSDVLLSSVNDRSSLSPNSARAVLDAHRIQLTLGDFDGALTTARLHVGGLIGHAKALGLAAHAPAEFDQARRAYAEILRMIQGGARAFETTVVAYVRHYHGYNGHRARTIGLDGVTKDYEAAVNGWPENALFHARRIALAAERGDLDFARRSFLEAMAQVPDHVRKDAYLRIRAASWAHRAGSPLFAFELLDDYRAPDGLADVDLTAHAYLRRLESNWAKGVLVERLTTEARRSLVFRGPLTLQVEHTGPTDWTARMEYPPARASGSGPLTAVRALATFLADEIVRLVSQPTGRLERHDVGRKGLYLGALDLGLSDLGLPHQGTRWLVGTLKGGAFVPVDEGLEALPVPPALDSETSAGMFLARVPVGRAGLPDGPMDRLIEAGAGRTSEELLVQLRSVAAGDDDAA